MAGRLVLVFGDQLDRGGATFDGFDRGRDRVWMAEVAEESTRFWMHKARIAVFLAGMRHFRDALGREGIDVEPGEWRAQEALRGVAKVAGIPFEIRPDRHFFATRDEFAAHARGRKQLRLEYFYRPLREKFGVLMDGGEPAGGRWN